MLSKTGLTRRLVVAGFSAGVLGSALWLPVDRATAPWASPLLLLVKTSAWFLALLVPLLGYGEPLIRFCDALAARAGSPDTSALPAVFRASVAAFVGLIAAGTAMFLSGLLLGPTIALAWAVLGVGYLGFLAGPRGDLGYAGLRREWAAWSPAERGVAWLLIGIAAIRLSAAFAFQQHEDAYTHNLAMADTWIRTGRTGVYLDNLYSGLSFAPEHYYLLLRLLFRGIAEQNATAQLSHVVLGHGLAVFALMVLSRRWLCRFAALTVGLFALQSDFMFFSQLPKNDTYVVAAALVSVVALLRGWPAGFIAAGAAPLIVKMNGAIVLPAMAAGALMLPAQFGRDGRWRRTLVLLLVAGIVALACWGVYAANNFARTGNPMMPVANHLFRSPFAPAAGTAILSGVAFFGFTWIGVFRSPLTLVLQHPLFVAGALAGLVVVIFRRRLADGGARVPRDYGYSLVIAAAYFYLLQIASGEFARGAEARHFQVTLLLLLPLAVWPLWTILTATRRIAWLRWGLVAVALAGSHADTFVRSFGGFLVSGNHTRAILSHKPVLDLNDALSQRVDVTGGTPIVLALCRENTPLFLRNARFWHRTFTYPVWSWPMERFTAADWRVVLATHGIDYAIVSGDQPDAERGLLQLPFTVVATHGRHRLIEFDK